MFSLGYNFTFNCILIIPLIFVIVVISLLIYRTCYFRSRAVLWNHSVRDKDVGLFNNFRLEILLDIWVILRTSEVDPEQSRHKIGFACLNFAAVFKLCGVKITRAHNVWKKFRVHTLTFQKYDNIHSQVTFVM